ncbi:hypothetical protein [Hyphomicrobium sulfonivorans]|uniref:hypothetical protein n=1 Tax=Hyphomicrobium sulfonivorans TaxID=121290 RepID=UPI00156FD56A|nr:hypothetical protein [Hyphomicrobium sulfonivorans]MBI1649890.1 hypothetical protein [Hyphomicrobium sulfonivorans]NSL71801.1 hypothetical protein [Hyphomicrobium sulfonivorans]
MLIGLAPLVMAGDEVIRISNAVDVANLNLFAAAGSPTQPVIVALENTGVIYSANANLPALNTAGFAAGSKVYIINRGGIYGAPGNGGAGGSVGGGIGAGGNGGHAIALGSSAIIDNALGQIFGGGAGGGGGGTYYYSDKKYTAGGGGGGGGQGYVASAGGARGTGKGGTPDACHGYAGYPGGYTGPGNGGPGGEVYGNIAGSGGNGGAWGTNGSAGASSHTAGAPGGVGGRAIVLNGNAVTWLAGNGADRVKGLIL